MRITNFLTRPLKRIFAVAVMTAFVGVGMVSCSDDDDDDRFFKSNIFTEAAPGLWVAKGNPYSYFLNVTPSSPKVLGQNVSVAFIEGKFHNFGSPGLQDLGGKGFSFITEDKYLKLIDITEFSSKGGYFTISFIDRNDFLTFNRLADPELAVIYNKNYTDRAFDVEVEVYESQASSRPKYRANIGRLGSGNSTTVPFWADGEMVKAFFYEPDGGQTIVFSRTWTELKPQTVYTLNL